jgi:hypothetical protein
MGLALVAALAASFIAADSGIGADDHNCLVLHPWGISNVPVIDGDRMLLGDDYYGLQCHLLQP